MTRGDEKRLERALDRIEERLYDAARGFHEAGGPADVEGLSRSLLPDDVRRFWARWDGMDLGHGSVTIGDVDAVETLTTAAREEGLIGAGDVLFAQRGDESFVFPEDPWEEGAEVVLVDDQGSRFPMSGTLTGFVLAQIGELSVLYDEEGEFQEDTFGEDGELTPAVRRRLLRRHLDYDPDAPLARLQLGQSLRREGDLEAALREFEAVLVRAPSFAWAQVETGRAAVVLGRYARAQEAFRAALESERDPDLKTFVRAWLALAMGEGEARERLAAEVLSETPDFASQEEAAAREALGLGDVARAREHVRLGLCVSPRALGLMALRRELEGTRES